MQNKMSEVLNLYFPNHTINGTGDICINALPKTVYRRYGADQSRRVWRGGNLDSVLRNKFGAQENRCV